MKLEIKLKDPKYCDGCPCLDDEYDTCDFHKLHLEIDTRDLKSDIKETMFYYIRPQKCIEENGN